MVDIIGWIIKTKENNELAITCVYRIIWDLKRTEQHMKNI